MKTQIITALLLISTLANAQSNKDICGDRAALIAKRIRAMGVFNANVNVSESEFKGDLIGIQQLDGIYKITFSNKAEAELRLNQFCQVEEFRLK